MYQQVPTDDVDKEAGDDAIKNERKRRNFVFRILVACAIMYSIFLGVRHVSRLRMMHGGIGCQKPLIGHHKNMSTGALPTHFTLPSGDKIPSVALGR